MGEKMNNLQKDVEEIKDALKKLKEEVIAMRTKLMFGGVILYTLINILLKKVGI